MKTILKSISLVVGTLLALSLTACQSDNEDLIIGSWNVEDITVTETARGTTHTETERPSDEGGTVTITYNKDLSWVGSVTYVDEGERYTDTDRGTYSINGDLLTMTSTYSWENGDGEWESEVETVTYTISSLDKKEMTLTLTLSETDTEDEVTYQVTETVRLKRI